MSQPSELREALIKASTTFTPVDVPEHAQWIAGKEIILEPQQIDAILDAVIASLPPEKPGIESQGDDEEDFYCIECGGYDECDCEGYNDALEDIRVLLQSAKSKGDE